jgi:hypothetical protein
VIHAGTDNISQQSLPTGLCLFTGMEQFSIFAFS